MYRYRLTIEYDGTPFGGWQRQNNAPSIQAALEEAFARFAGERPLVVGAGRTDAGVHALAQVAHVDLQRRWRPDRLVAALNAHLRPQPVAVLEARLAGEGFHARFSARERRYVYRILNRRAPAALEAARVWHVPAPLASEHMQEAAQALVGRNDFTSFRSSECQAASPLRTLDLLHVRRAGDLIEIHAAARSFLHHQVRNIAGSLKLVGEGRRSIGWISEALAARDRSAAGPTAPAQGLFLVGVGYPVEPLSAS
ncbi:tRNA pseudouridine(38-40) synthase TruA [Marinimicrococcus flavescens]|uniref:tRNA pseudouridine synthase A n=1 Tax=Marinimicrococcus flavescens TaxID=3031815 RepID=A0AAP3V0P0_9PROT|nr:tRNA pseudouridine(38-40) synthase TruA [Marinimicrococcus flavescens]